MRINEGYEFALAECAQALQVKTEALRAWAEANPDQFAKGRKSIEFLSGTLGFRTGTPKLALVSRAWTWVKALAAVQLLLPSFIRSVPEIDKEAIIAQREELAEFLPKCGLKVAQDESFFVEPKLTEVETRQVSQAA